MIDSLNIPASSGDSLVDNSVALVLVKVISDADCDVAGPKEMNPYSIFIDVILVRLLTI